MINLKRIFVYSLFGIAITTLSSFLFYYTFLPKHDSIAKVEEKVEEKKCEEFAILVSSSNQKVQCPLGFIETHESEQGKFLIICYCQDPLRCSNN